MLRKTESPPDPATAPGKAKLRTWKDATGQFSEQAILVRVRGEQVVLRCTDNNEISVPITTLCMTDRQYLEEIDDKTAVAALDKLGAMIKRSKEGSVVYVNLTGTLITDAGIAELRKALPN